jgi:hypothetical protein
MTADGNEILQGMTLVEEAGVLVPHGPMPEELEAKCPGASITRFQNTGRPAIFCGPADEAFAVEDNPVGALGWCCGGYHSCPIWVAEKDQDPALARQRVARAVAARKRMTEQQIRSGLRVDDAGVERRDAALERERQRGADPERDAAQSEGR